MKIPFGLAGRLVISFIALALLAQWLNYHAARDLRSAAVHQREIDKVKTVARVIEPRLKREAEWVTSVARLVECELTQAMQLRGKERKAAVAAILDFSFQQSGVDVMEVTDTRGIILYRAQDRDRSGDLASFWGVEEALTGDGTIVSVRETWGTLVLYIEPIRAGGKVIGTVSAGTRIDERFISRLSAETGAELALLSRTRDLAVSSQSGKMRPDATAITEAFEQKIPVFRTDELTHNTMGYLPVLIVDDAWVMIAGIDSSSAFELLEKGDEKAVLITLLVMGGSILIIFVVLRIALKPLRDLRLRAERIVVQSTGRTVVRGASDDIVSLVDNLNNLTGILLDRNRELTQQRTDLRLAAAAFDSQESMVVTDANTVILRVNKAFTEITGYTADDVVGRKSSMFRPDRYDADLEREIWETIHRVGRWQGEVLGQRKNGDLYPKWLTISAVRNDAGAVTHYIITHSDISERKKAEEKIEELVFFDALTGLPNRKLLMERLRQAMADSRRNGAFGAVLFIDLDDFKILNDTLGHEQGDRLLQQVAQRLPACVSSDDTVARLGGDEFVVVLGNLDANFQEAVTQTEVAGERILAALNNAYPLGDIDHRTTASIGATLFFGEQTPIDDLLKQGDLAMYKAKDSGRNTLRFFDPAMQTIVMERADLENDLRCSLELRQFVLHYQPQVVGNGRVTGAEVLVRWSHPVRGMVSPAAFIPLAEETGLILPLGLWVLETACAQLARWAMQPDTEHLTVAVNVSARQFHHPGFVGQVLSALRDSGANAQRLKLELTESMLVENVQEIIEKMFTLKAQGVCFSLDDFGTGYSSLTYLKRLPLEQLKIDQSFVRDVLVDPNDAAIARTVVALAQSLGLGVIAEGVETAAQRDFLASSGCHAYQGYYFSQPLPVDEFEKFARGM